MVKQVVRRNRAEANDVSNDKPIYTLLIDGNSLLKISLVDKRMNGKGEEYGAIFLFLRQLGNLLQKKDFNHCVCCWDGYNSGILRYNIYKDYKANRDKHYDMFTGATEYDIKIAEYCKKVLKYHNSKKKETVRAENEDEAFQRQRYILQTILENLYVRQFMYDNVEGDDLIANYVKNKLPNEKVVIVSGDRDLSQLIADDVCLYIPSLKKFVTPNNSVELLGITHKNVVLEKMLCGDASDNIKGIKGMGKQTLFKYFPSIKDVPTSLNSILERSEALLDERKADKKKPLVVLENVLKSITDGSQGKDIYEINRKIIDLSEPMLTEEAEQGMKEEMHAPLSPDGRDIKNIYNIIYENGMSDMLDEHKFGNLFGMYEKLIKMETEYGKVRL